MSEEESLNLDEVGSGNEEAESGGRKGGFFSGMLIRILQWAAIALGIIILVVSVTVITLNRISRGRTAQELASVSPQYEAKEDPYEYYDGIEGVRGVTSDEVPRIFSIRVSVGYQAQNAVISNELIARNREIGDILFRFVSQKNADELKPIYYERLAEELKNQINRVMKGGKIRKVVFREFVVTQ